MTPEPMARFGRWHLRSFHESDRARLIRFANNPKVSGNLRDSFPYPYSDDDATCWLDFVGAQNPCSAFAIAEDEGLVGGIGLELKSDIYHRTAELGYWLGEEFWGQGIATQAVAAVTRWGFEQLGLLRIYGGVFDRNRASARVLEKAGFELEATHRRAVVKRGEVMDELIYVRFA